MEIISKKTVWEGRFIRTVLIKYRGRNGDIHTWEAVERVGARGVVVIVPVTREHELVLIRQFRPALGCHVIELPAGLVETGEHCIETCRRELIEETGYTSDDLGILAEGVMSTGITSDIWKVIYACQAYKASNEIRKLFPPDRNEDIETFTVPLNSVDGFLEEASNRGEYPDLRIFGMVELFRRRSL
jgi:ADP-ribose pyrophosphatase